MQNQINDAEICKCTCHEPDGNVLIHGGEGPCCEQCPHCLERIKIDLFEGHVPACPRRPKADPDDDVPGAQRAAEQTFAEVSQVD